MVCGQVNISPSLITEVELLEMEPCNPTTDGEVWDKAMNEVAKGWLKGPPKPHEVPDHALPP